jgi:hypothetical protein
MSACSIYAASRPIWRALENFYFLAPKDWTTAVFLMLSPDVYEHLISWDVAPREVGSYEMWIPHVECWYPSSLDFTLIEEAIVVDITRTEPTGLAKVIIEANKIMEDEEN